MPVEGFPSSIAEPLRFQFGVLDVVEKADVGTRVLVGIHFDWHVGTGTRLPGENAGVLRRSFFSLGPAGHGSGQSGILGQIFYDRGPSMSSCWRCKVAILLDTTKKCNFLRGKSRPFLMVIFQGFTMDGSAWLPWRSARKHNRFHTRLLKWDTSPAHLLGPPVVPYPFLGEGSTKIDRKKGTLILRCLLEDLASKPPITTNCKEADWRSQG